jgi:hypothetical protein
MLLIQYMFLTEVVIYVAYVCCWYMLQMYVVIYVADICG